MVDRDEYSTELFFFHAGLWARTAAARAILEVAERHPEARDCCITALRATLARYRTNEPELNGSIISYLVDLDAVQVAPLMERAFNAGAVDLFVQGDWEDVQALLVRKREEI